MKKQLECASKAKRQLYSVYIQYSLFLFDIWVWCTFLTVMFLTSFGIQLIYFLSLQHFFLQVVWFEPIIPLKSASLCVIFPFFFCEFSLTVHSISFITTIVLYFKIRMHPAVRDLYKRFIASGRVYPQGLDFIRQKAKQAFLANRDLHDELELKRAIAKGRHMVREINAISKLHKYRTLKKRYGQWLTFRPHVNAIHLSFNDSPLERDRIPQ